MTLAASVVLDRAATTLLDQTGTAWPVAELIDYLNAARRQAVHLKADSYTVLGDIALVAGPDQVLPADGISVVSLYRNTNGKRAVRQVGLDNIQATNPMWAANTPSAIVREYMIDTRDPKRFMVSPPNDGTGSLTGVYSAAPTPIADPSEPILLPDTYDGALWAYVISMAYAKSSTTQDLPKHTAYMQMFMALLTGKTATLKQTMPDLKQMEQAQS
jgi:hypothetical protein